MDDTHLHVPRWVHHPERSPETVDDVVSTCEIFTLVRQAGLGSRPDGTILDPGYRARHPVVLAEHFHYPHARGMAARYRQNLAAAVCGRTKQRGRGVGSDHRGTANARALTRRG